MIYYMGGTVPHPRPSTKLKILYYFSCLVIVSTAVLLVLALVGVTSAFSMGRSVPFVVPIVFVGLLVLLLAGLHASGFFYILRKMKRYNIYVSEYYDVRHYFSKEEEISRERVRPWRIERYRIHGGGMDVIVFPVTVLLPRPQRIAIHLIPKGLGWQAYVEQYLRKK